MLKDELLKAQIIEKQAKEKAYKAGEEMYGLEQLRPISLFENKLEEVKRLSEEIESIRPQVFDCWTDFYRARLSTGQK